MILQEGNKVEAYCGSCDQIHEWKVMVLRENGNITMQRDWARSACTCARQTADAGVVVRKLGGEA